ncbi:SDR family oxidoreductase [Cerasicoccus maritimus]|uniref:SDR family oxidoreductase n=1 Tax=Cerasicoccus maritimus TaxID=490089 RepID=UPI0028528ADC|nr:SDR family oxidoreductase [Cerasicoccus maritimus]
MNKIQNKTVLITGANRGIGKALVTEFINAGAAKVYAAVRNVKSAQPLVDEFGDRVVPIYADLSDLASIKQAAQTATDVDVVINNAGIISSLDILDESALGEIDTVFDVNVKGLLRVAQAFAPVLKANGGGTLVQLNSVASLKDFDGLSTYCASKAASYSFTQALRTKLAEQGTQLVSVHPGPIATDMGDEAGFTDVAEPPSLVATGVIRALENNEFFVFPDSVARQFHEAYQGFAKTFVTPEAVEA